MTQSADRESARPPVSADGERAGAGHDRDLRKASHARESTHPNLDVVARERERWGLD